jgi:uncharacterized damage-inducible protein DinB
VVLARGRPDRSFTRQKLSVEEFTTFSALRGRAEAEDHHLLEYVSQLSAAELNHTVTYTWPQARPRSRPLWQLLFHIFNHGTHHRSELGRYMDGLGHSPGDIDFMKFLVRKNPTQNNALGKRWNKG